MRYAVLFPVQGGVDGEGKSWAIVDAEEPAQAASMAGGRSVAQDDKALVIPLENGEPTPVYAKVGWTA